MTVIPGGTRLQVAPQPVRAAAGTDFTVFESIEAVAPLREAWLRLQQRSGRVTPNADPDRFAATCVARAGSATPFVGVVGDPSAPRAMIVARRERRRLSFPIGYKQVTTPTKLSCLDVVYGGLLADADDATAREAVVNELGRMVARGEVDHIMLNHVEREGAMMRATADRFAAAARLARVERHWTLEFTGGSWESAAAAFGKKHRYNMRRADAKLVEHFGRDVQVRVVTAPEQLDDFSAAAAAIARRTYQSELGAGYADTPLWRAILRREASNGRLRCYLLSGNGQPVAFQVGCVYGRRYFLEAIGYLPDLARWSPGTVLLLRSFKELSDVGVGAIDYGFGDAEYKRIYGSRNWEEATVHLYGRGVRPAIAKSVEGVARAAERTACRLAGSEGLVKRMKKLWRGRLARSARLAEASPAPGPPPREHADPP